MRAMVVVMGLRFILQFVLGAFGFALVVELVSGEGQSTIDLGGTGFGAGALVLFLVVDVIAIVLVGFALPDRPASRETNQTVIRVMCSLCAWTATCSNADDARELGHRHHLDTHPEPTQPRSS